MTLDDWVGMMESSFHWGYSLGLVDGVKLFLVLVVGYAGVTLVLEVGGFS